MKEKKVYKKYYCPYCDTSVTRYYSNCPACHNELIWHEEYSQLKAKERYEEAIEHLYCNGFHIEPPMTTGEIKIRQAVEIASGYKPDKDK